jgi:LmbE family N-acetylglucosaminyl deacetylase
MNSDARPAVLGVDRGPWDRVCHWLVLAPHPDDFDVVAVTVRYFAKQGAEIALDVLSGGASGVEDAFADGWESKASAREAEQRESCAIFGLLAKQIRFHRLAEDGEGFIAYIAGNQTRVHAMLDAHSPDGVILPHGNDSNADHRRTFRWFNSWRKTRNHPPLALLVRDPKTRAMRVDLIAPYDADTATWKTALLRCHRSQHERNLRQRGIGFDERILGSDRAAAGEWGFQAAETFELLA